MFDWGFWLWEGECEVEGGALGGCGVPLDSGLDFSGAFLDADLAEMVWG
jgi:hypothetical protein